MKPGPLCYFGHGRRMDVFNFVRDDLDPIKLGVAMSRTNRFGGNGILPMNIAQHCWNLSYLVGDDLNRQRAALMHDMPEIFTGEVPRPIKRMCPDLEAVDHQIMLRVSEVYNIPMSAFDAIKEMDTRISYDERLFMFGDMSEQDKETARDNCLGLHIVPISAEQAAQAWTRRFHQLGL